MKLAVVSLTEKGFSLGVQTALKLADRGHGVEVYFPQDLNVNMLEENVICHSFQPPLKDLIKEIFEAYDGILCVMALGIVVRVIGPLLQSKLHDPAVVVMDERGQNVISVLSGHWGRANDLTREIASVTGANPVITTATDVNLLPAIDVIARNHGLIPESLEMIRRVNADIIRGRKVTIYTEYPLNPSEQENWGESIEVKPFDAYPGFDNKGLDNKGAVSGGPVVLVTNRELEGRAERTFYLRPRNIIAGIGCRRGVTKNEVIAAIKNAFVLAGRSLLSLKALASVDIKADEAGLMEAARELDVPVAFYTRDDIRQVMEERSQEMEISETVQGKIGVGGVCEPAAVLKAGAQSKMLLTKQVLGRVTVALAEEN